MNTRYIPTPESLTLSAMTRDALALSASLPPTAAQRGVQAARSVPAGVCPVCTKCRLYDGLDTCYNCGVLTDMQQAELLFARQYPQYDALLGPYIKARHARRQPWRDAAWGVALILLLAAAVWLGLAVRGGGAI